MTDPVLALNGQSLVTRADGRILLMGPKEPNPYRIEDADYYAKFDVSSADEENPAGGLLGGHNMIGMRPITQLITLTNWDWNNPAQARTDREALEAFWLPSSGVDTIAWQEGGVQRLRFGQCRGVDVRNRVKWYKTLLTRFDALVPYSYSAAETHYGPTVDQVVVNSGLLPTIAWRISIPGPFMGAVLTYGIGGGRTNTVAIPAAEADETFYLDAMLGQSKMVADGGGVRGVTPKTDGLSAQYLALPVGNSHFTLDAAESVEMEIWVRSCWP